MAVTIIIKEDATMELIHTVVTMGQELEVEIIKEAQVAVIKIATIEDQEASINTIKEITNTKTSPTAPRIHIITHQIILEEAIKRVTVIMDQITEDMVMGITIITTTTIKAVMVAKVATMEEDTPTTTKNIKYLSIRTTIMAAIMEITMDILHLSPQITTSMASQIACPSTKNKAKGQ